MSYPRFYILSITAIYVIDSCKTVEYKDIHIQGIYFPYGPYSASAISPWRRDEPCVTAKTEITWAGSLYQNFQRRLPLKLEIVSNYFWSDSDEIISN